ncbi:carboxypeptidase-like regulatory domain-containing protein [uncultured Croceitalea sp.]|uniref:carboxypeptidase-like regulatory domain-containing protein n=1 Tax=uncultured Croceitalea sp. TaxID=1798908 RepID=UPI0033067653
MHKLTLVLLLAFFSAFGYSQNTVTGKIVDELGLPIYLASVEIDQTGEVVYTDYDGNFSLTSKKGFHWKINITSTGYKPESFFVLSNGKTESLMLEYNEKMKKLLNENSKLSNNSYGFLFKKPTLYFKLSQPLTH